VIACRHSRGFGNLMTRCDNSKQTSGDKNKEGRKKMEIQQHSGDVHGYALGVWQ